MKLHEIKISKNPGQQLLEFPCGLKSIAGVKDDSDGKSIRLFFFLEPENPATTCHAWVAHRNSPEVPSAGVLGITSSGFAVVSDCFL